LNLLAAILAVLAGFTLYYIWRPALFGQHEFAHWAFWFLIVQWIVFVAIFIIKLRWEDYRGWLMAAVDLQSICAIGFAWTFLQGDSFSWRRTCGALALICLTLWLWNLGTNPDPGSTDISVRLRWVAPSEAVSAFAVPLVGFAFFLRYREYAFPLFLTSLAYSACQRPIYSATFVRVADSVQTGPDVSKYLLALAVGKLVLAGLTYALFFAPVETYPSATPPLADATATAIGKALWKATKFLVGALLIPLASGLIVAIVEKFL